MLHAQKFRSFTPHGAYLTKHVFEQYIPCFPSVAGRLSSTLTACAAHRGLIIKQFGIDSCLSEKWIYRNLLPVASVTVRTFHYDCVVFNKYEGVSRHLIGDRSIVIRTSSFGTSADDTQSGASGAGKSSSKDTNGAQEKLSLYQRFKKMWRQYWYVLLPVHLVTSVMWFGGFYYTSVSGLDVIGLLEKIGISETVLSPIKRLPQAGHVAIAYALYKVATPLRYTVTLGGTHIAIKHLGRLGLIKPAPTPARVREFIGEKRDLYSERYGQWRSTAQRKDRVLDRRTKDVMRQEKRPFAYYSQLRRNQGLFRSSRLF